MVSEWKHLLTDAIHYGGKWTPIDRVLTPQDTCTIKGFTCKLPLVSIALTFQMTLLFDEQTGDVLALWMLSTELSCSLLHVHIRLYVHYTYMYMCTHYYIQISKGVSEVFAKFLWSHAHKMKRWAFCADCHATSMVLRTKPMDDVSLMSLKLTYCT